jgi:prolyl-tRNA editing enzyme YbaK/EbsC (Cys-tRNA(Pro) deacylase)
MAVEEVKAHLEKFNRADDIKILNTSTATVELAAQALNVEPARIAKSLSFKTRTGAMIVVTAGDARIDNSKFKSEFGIKAKMLSPDEVTQYTGHPVGGVSPFGLKTDSPVYLDESLKRFVTVFPACGSPNSAIELTLPELEEFSGCIKWVNVCKDWK